MSKARSFIQGAVILSVAGALSKVLGAIYRIPLARWIEADGMGLYQMVYPIYTTVLALATAGVPIAISIMISRKRTEGCKGDARRIFKVSMAVLVCVGAALTVLVMLLAPYIADYVLHDPETRLPIMAVAPAIFVSAMMAVYRGYFQGHQDMSPTGISQVVEQLFRVTAILALALFLIQKGLTYAVAGATAGAAIGGVAGLMVLIFFYYKYQKSNNKEEEELLCSQDSPGQIARELVRLAVPVSVGAVVLPLVQMLDAIIVPLRLATIDPALLNATPRELYGHLSGMAAVLISLPTIFTISISTSLVPSVAEAMAVNDLDLLKQRINYGIRAGMIIALPCAAGLFALAVPICDLLYKAPLAGIPLEPLAFSCVTLAAFQLSSAGLQGIGRPEIAMRSLILTGLMKVVFNYTLTAIPVLNIVGAAAGTVMAFLIGSLVNLFMLWRLAGVAYEWQRFVKISLICVLMGGAAWLVNDVLAGLQLPVIISAGGAMLAGVAVYAGLMLATRELDSEMLNAIKGSGTGGEVIAG